MITRRKKLFQVFQRWLVKPQQSGGAEVTTMVPSIFKTTFLLLVTTSCLATTSLAAAATLSDARLAWGGKSPSARQDIGLFVWSCVRPVLVSGVIVRPTSLSNCTCVAPEYCNQDDLVNQVLSNVTHLVTTKISKGRRSDQPQTWLPRQLCVLHLPTHKQVS